MVGGEQDWEGKRRRKTKNKGARRRNGCDGCLNEGRRKMMKAERGGGKRCARARWATTGGKVVDDRQQGKMMRM